MRRNRNVRAAVVHTLGVVSRFQTLRRWLLFIVMLAICLLLHGYFELKKIANSESGRGTNSSSPASAPRRKLLQVQKPISDESLTVDVLHSQENRLAIQDYVEGTLFNHLNWNSTSGADSFIFTCHYTSSNDSRGIVCSSTCNSVSRPQINALSPNMDQLFDPTDDRSDDTTSRSSGIVNGTHFQSSLLNSIWFCSIAEDSQLSHGLQYSCIISNTKGTLASSWQQL